MCWKILVKKYAVLFVNIGSSFSYYENEDPFKSRKNIQSSIVDVP